MDFTAHQHKHIVPGSVTLVSVSVTLSGIFLHVLQLIRFILSPLLCPSPQKKGGSGTY